MCSQDYQWYHHSHQQLKCYAMILIIIFNVIITCYITIAVIINFSDCSKICINIIPNWSVKSNILFSFWYKTLYNPLPSSNNVRTSPVASLLKGPVSLFISWPHRLCQQNRDVAFCLVSFNHRQHRTKGDFAQWGFSSTAGIRGRAESVFC